MEIKELHLKSFISIKFALLNIIQVITLPTLPNIAECLEQKSLILKQDKVIVRLCMEGSRTIMFTQPTVCLFNSHICLLLF